MGKEVLTLGDIENKKIIFTAMKVLSLEEMWIMRMY